ncbi:hypothetical protein LFZ31_08720 [Salmonella enterica subsp. enterica serovar Newport str. S09097]|nr:hypothetical protein LFZ31_08720 [Salmonella enterica subsp. enterica serovar Newport str. S09097]
MLPDLFRSYTFVLDVQCVLLHKQKNKNPQNKIISPKNNSVKHHVMDMFFISPEAYFTHTIQKQFII